MDHPKISCPLEPAFLPAAVFNRNYAASVLASGRAVPLVIGCERENNLLSRYETIINPGADAETLLYVERIVKFLLWARGGWKIYVGGPAAVGEYIRKIYSSTGARAFDAELMGRVYGRAFEVAVVDADSVPETRETAAALGRHLDGYRLGFDLGASDYKVAALKDGNVVFSEEFPWAPKDEADPEYHYRHLSQGLKKAAAYLPRVDAIGGSSAGVIVDNKIMVASLFRAVPAAEFDRAKNIFLRIRDEWKVPVEVANDGDVTALAGAMSLEARGLLGIAMGSSQAAGYINPNGCMTGWLNELAFAPVDYHAGAKADEWSGDHGVGALYFSQQAVHKLLPATGLDLPGQMSQPELLKAVQDLMARGDEKAVRIYETIGFYLGYSIAHYADFYEFTDMLVLGRVMTGTGGDMILDKAREVLEAEFPEIGAKVRLHAPDEKSKRVGQAIAAASLPEVGR